MTYIGLPAVIALFGHTGSQASQAVQVVDDHQGH